ncbi:MAG: secondary thiamine-phosphate synthase enzyme YjbQ, partial [Candidatus Acidiferrales bacterium]
MKKESSENHTVHKIAVRTTRRTELKNVTAEIESLVRSSGIDSGVCHMYVPHTTAGVIVNEGYDPGVARDMEGAFDRPVPDSPLFK